MNLTNKNVLVTGANGLVGIPTVRKCVEEGANKVYAVDKVISDDLAELKALYPEKIVVVNTDLTYLHNCYKLFDKTDINIVIHSAGIKGSPVRTASSPADYVFPMLMFNTNMMKAAYDSKVDWFVYLSSVGVYSPSDLMVEDSVWSTFPSKNDWFPGWAKRMGELALESLQVQHGWNNWTIIRPSNIYGINDNFAQDATVISSNIWKLFNSPDDTMICWGDGSPKRDFVFADDVAQATIDVVKKEVKDIINFGCGDAVSIKETIESMVQSYTELTGKTKQIVWDTTKPNGDMIRRLDSTKQQSYNILPHTSLSDGIKYTITGYMNKNEKN